MTTVQIADDWGTTSVSTRLGIFLTDPSRPHRSGSDDLAWVSRLDRDLAKGLVTGVHVSQICDQAMVFSDREQAVTVIRQIQEYLNVCHLDYAVDVRQVLA